MRGWRGEAHLQHVEVPGGTALDEQRVAEQLLVHEPLAYWSYTMNSAMHCYALWESTPQPVASWGDAATWSVQVYQPAGAALVESDYLAPA